MGPVKYDKVNKTWSTMENPSIFNPNVSIAHLLLKSMEWNGSKIAQVSSTCKWLEFKYISHLQYFKFPIFMELKNDRVGIATKRIKN